MTNHCSDCSFARLCIDPELLQETRNFLPTIAKPTKYSAGEILFQPNLPAKYFFFVRTGMVKLFEIDKDGKEQITSFFFPGELVGIHAIFDNTYHHYASVLATSEICRVSYEQVMDSSQTKPWLSKHLLCLMSHYMLHSNIPANSSAEQRLATFLLNTIKRLEAQNLNDNNIRLKIKRDDLANHLGLASETISRMLLRLQQEGAIYLEQRAICILSQNKLAQIAKNPLFLI